MNQINLFEIMIKIFLNCINVMAFKILIFKLSIIWSFGWLVGWLVFYRLSTLVGYSLPNHIYIYIYIYIVSLKNVLG